MSTIFNFNDCDHGHYGHRTKSEVRVLPVSCHSNIIVCRHHFLQEMEYRRSRIKAGLGHWEIPKWEDLEVYKQEE